jgi:hypothetical protein
MARQGVIQNTKGKSVVTPLGEALWVKVIEPDYKFDAKGKYSADVVLDPSDEGAAKFIKVMEGLRDRALAEAKENLAPAKAKQVVSREVFWEDTDKEGEPTGKIVIKTKANAIDYNEEAVNIPVFNAKGIEEEGWNSLIGNGSKVKLQVWASPYHMANGNYVGISYKLKKVQIIELSAYSGGGDEGFGDETGDGFGEEVAATATDSDF